MAEVEFGMAVEEVEPEVRQMKTKRVKRIPRAGSFDPSMTDEPLYEVPAPDEKLIVKPEDAAMGRIFNWYSASKDHSDSNKYILAWLKHTEAPKDRVDLVRSVPESVMSVTAGWIARQLTLGAPMPKKATDFLDAQISKAVAFGLGQIKAQQAQTQSKRRPNIQESIDAQVNLVLANINGEIDDFIENKFKSDFSFKAKYGQSDSLKPVHLKRIADYIEKCKAEWELALSGEDEQVKEGYSCFSKSQLKKCVEFLNNMLAEILNKHELSKKIRKSLRVPRRRKQKSPHELTTRTKYLKEFPELNLKSLLPAKIVGAEQVWIYNTKLRRLGLYKANSIHGLSIKGTTILHFDEAESQEKKLRKPKDIIPKVLESGKVALRRILEDLKSKPKVPKGRLNEFCVIVRAI